MKFVHTYFVQHIALAIGVNLVKIWIQFLNLVKLTIYFFYRLLLFSTENNHTHGTFTSPYKSCDFYILVYSISKFLKIATWAIWLQLIKSWISLRNHFFRSLSSKMMLPRQGTDDFILHDKTLCCKTCKLFSKRTVAKMTTNSFVYRNLSYFLSTCIHTVLGYR